MLYNRRQPMDVYCWTYIHKSLLMTSAFGSIGLPASDGSLRLLKCCPPSGGSTNAALSSAKPPFQHLKSPTSIGSSDCLPRALSLQLRNRLSYVGDSGSSVNLISDIHRRSIRILLLMDTDNTINALKKRSNS